MTKEFNKEILFSNIYHLLKVREIKVGELESYVGVSAGYISRINKEQSTKPGLEFIIKVADKLGVTVDELLSVNFEGLTNTELYIINFLNKLTEDTRAEKLLWERESAEYLNRLDSDGFGNVDHYLFSVESVKHVHEDRVLVNDEVVYVSDTFGNQTFIHGDCYNLRLKNEAYLYLMDIGKEPKKVGEEFEYAKEIIMFKPQFGRQFLCSSVAYNFSEKIQLLFDAVAEYFRHPLVNSEFRYSIDAFMKDDLKDDAPKNSPFDEEVPF